MIHINLTPQEIQFLFSLLDQSNIRGIQSKQLVLMIMVKLFEAAQPSTEETPNAQNISD